MADFGVTDWDRIIDFNSLPAPKSLDFSKVLTFTGAQAALDAAMRGLRAHANVELTFSTNSNIREQIEEVVNDAMRDGRVGTSQVFGRGADIGDRGF